MREEQGRSLIEIIGVLAIGAIITAGAITTYNIVRNRMVRTVAVEELGQIVKNTRLLMSMRNDYSGVSVDYLIKAGALKTNKAPMGGADWSITSSVDGNEFLVNLTRLSKKDCDFFAVVKLDWAEKIRINGYDIDPGIYCLGSGDNQISFIVK